MTDNYCIIRLLYRFVPLLEMWDSGTKWDSKVSCYRTYHTIFVTLDKYCLVENKYYVVFDKIVKNTANRPSGWLNLIQCFDKRPQSLFGFG